MSLNTSGKEMQTGGPGVPSSSPIVGVLGVKADSAAPFLGIVMALLALNQFEVEKSDSSVTLQLMSTEETRKSYPL